MLIEHRLRKGQYPVQDYETARKLPPGWAAVTAMVIGLVVAAFGVNQAATINMRSVGEPLETRTWVSRWRSSSPASLYFILRRIELARSGR